MNTPAATHNMNTPAATLLARADAILVDLDGTLVDSTAPVRRAWDATSCSTALAHARLAAARLAIPRVLVSSDGLERGKPDPGCFLIAARLLDTDPACCVVIEDAPAGIDAGRAAGATVIGLRTTHTDDELRDAHAIVDDLAALVRSRGGARRSALDCADRPSRR
jgi:beta-phosphoglucomutase-like phosphatase (HAD superfamily)